MFELNWKSIPVSRGVSYIIVVSDGAKRPDAESTYPVKHEKTCWGGEGGGGGMEGLVVKFV